jgi:hypothetical protein
MIKENFSQHKYVLLKNNYCPHKLLLVLTLKGHHQVHINKKGKQVFNCLPIYLFMSVDDPKGSKHVAIYKEKFYF